MKKETKDRLKKNWEEALPFVLPVMLGVGALLAVYTKTSIDSSDNYAVLMKQRTEDSRRATDAYILMCEAETRRITKE